MPHSRESSHRGNNTGVDGLCSQRALTVAVGKDDDGWGRADDWLRLTCRPYEDRHSSLSRGPKAEASKLIDELRKWAGVK